MTVPLAYHCVALVAITQICESRCTASVMILQGGTHTDQTWRFTNPPPDPIPDPGGGRPTQPPIPPDTSQNPGGAPKLDPVGSFGWAGMAEGRQGVLGFTIGDLVITIPNVEEDVSKELIIDIIYLTSDVNTKLSTPTVSDALTGTWQPVPAKTDDSLDQGPPATTQGYQWRHFHAHFTTSICPDVETVRVISADKILAYDSIRVVTDCKVIPEPSAAALLGMSLIAVVIGRWKRKRLARALSAKRSPTIG